MADIFLIKLQLSACNFIKKEALAQVLSCELNEIFKKIFFRRTPLVAASEYLYLFLVKIVCSHIQLTNQSLYKK